MIDREGKTVRVLFVAAEADPLIKVGGLGDVAGTLPAELRKLDAAALDGWKLDVRLVIPYHAAIRAKKLDIRPLFDFPVERGEETITASAYVTDVNGMPVYLIDGAPFPKEGPVYSLNTVEDGEKFIFFSLAALDLAKKLDWAPDIWHANDWHTAISIYALAHRRKKDPFFAKTRTVLSLHNLPFMGGGTDATIKAYKIPFSRDPRLPAWGRRQPLPLGLLKADRVIAVSPSYAKEILTPEFGCSLEDFLATRQDAIMGILNGLDQQVWDPQNDPQIASPFSASDMSGNSENKRALLREFELPEKMDTPLLILISRMDQQKGVDIAIEGLRLLTGTPWQAILLGTGDPVLEKACQRLEKDFPDRVRAAIRFDAKLSHRMYAGGDMLLMPSRYEPCGLAQMIAMRYGCIPVARAVGGLKDTIVDDPKLTSGTGFLFEKATPRAFANALQRALKTYTDHAPEWQGMQKRGVQQDFSWGRYAVQYGNVYLDLMEVKR